MKAPSSSFGCGSETCEPCSGDAEWQAQRIYVAANEEGTIALAHPDCAEGVDDPADTMGGYEDGVSQYGWGSLECDVCGGNLAEPAP